MNFTYKDRVTVASIPWERRKSSYIVVVIVAIVVVIVAIVVVIVAIVVVIVTDQPPLAYHQLA